MSGWQIIPGFPDYEIDAYGAVVRRATDALWGHPLADKLHVRSPKGTPLQIRINERGYLYVRLPIGRRKYKDKLISRIVCEIFHGPAPTPTHQAAHWDGDVMNCHHSNLRWATAQENTEDKFRHGRVRRGEDSPASKLTSEQAREAKKLLAEGVSPAIIATQFAVTPGNIYAIKSGRTWKHIAEDWP